MREDWYIEYEILDDANSRLGAGRVDWVDCFGSSPDTSNRVQIPSLMQQQLGRYFVVLRRESAKTNLFISKRDWILTG